jgi:hypothetical protein
MAYALAAFCDIDGHRHSRCKLLLPLRRMNSHEVFRLQLYNSVSNPASF